MSERAVEKHTNSIFAKLGLSEEKDVNRRVKAVLLYLSEPRRRGRLTTPQSGCQHPRPAGGLRAKMES